MSAPHTSPPRQPDVLRSIPLALVSEHPGNPRERFQDLEELAASLLEVGLVEPIVVERADGGRYRLLAGARRVRAARMARLTELPAVIRPPAKSPVDAVALMLIENGQRRHLDPIEEARGYARMKGLDPSLTQADIARKVGKSQPHVNQRLMLLNLSHEEQEQVRRGELLLRDARDTARERAGTHKQTRFTGWHLGKTHPLGQRVKDRCRAHGHLDARRVGGMGCGQCWEYVIRADERARLATAAVDLTSYDTDTGSPDLSDTPPSSPDGVDEVAVLRAVGGDRGVTLTIPERREAIRRLHGHGLSDGQIADRLHLSPRTVLRARGRLGLPANTEGRTA